jgi:predicted SAM-dependent methyltransferase
MEYKASFRPDLSEFLLQRSEELTWLDRSLLKENMIPDEAFDIGVLNTDVVGYLFEYYTEYSDATAALNQVHRTLKKGGLLVVTNPCLQYTIDNVKVLEEIGFDFSEGYDIDLSTNKIIDINRDTPPKSMSRLNHYSFLILSKK